MQRECVFTMLVGYSWEESSRNQSSWGTCNPGSPQLLPAACDHRHLGALEQRWCPSCAESVSRSLLASLVVQKLHQGWEEMIVVSLQIFTNMISSLYPNGLLLNYLLCSMAPWPNGAAWSLCVPDVIRMYSLTSCLATPCCVSDSSWKPTGVNWINFIKKVILHKSIKF